LLRENDVVIREYKTGPVLEDGGTLAQDYVDQLHLYAALFHESDERGGWPISLELVAGDGTIHQVPLIQHQASGILELAKSEGMALKQACKEVLSGGITIGSIGSPGEQQCSGCPFRPDCPARRQRFPLPAAVHLKSRAVDVSGHFQSWHQAGPQLITLTFAEGYVVSGLAAEGDPRTATAISLVGGEKIEIFNVRPISSSQTSFRATPTTVVGRVPEE
jgi:hypothetical protein